MTAEGNTWTDYKQSVLIGFTGATNAVRDVLIRNERFVRCGSVGGIAVSVFQADYLTIEHVGFIDCGTGAAGSYALDFNTGASSYVTIDGMQVLSPTGKTLQAIVKESGHTFTPATNKFYRGELGGLSNTFTAEDSDMLEQSFLPLVTGSSTAGTGTYTMQYGVYKRIGKTVFFRIKLAVAAGHNGTGMIQVSLPLGAAPAGGNQERAIALAVDGVATTGGHIGLINPAVNIGGVLGAIRCYFNGAGVLGQTIIPSGAFTVYASGSYQAK